MSAASILAVCWLLALIALFAVVLWPTMPTRKKATTLTPEERGRWYAESTALGIYMQCGDWRSVKMIADRSVWLEPGLRKWIDRQVSENLDHNP